MTACLEATGASCLAAESLCAEDFSHLANPQVWIHGAVQIFFSLGVGYGSIVAFGSYGSKSGNFVRSRASLRRLSTLVPDLVFDRGTRCHFCRSPDGRPPMPPVPRHLHRRRLSLYRSEVAIANCGTPSLPAAWSFPFWAFSLKSCTSLSAPAKRLCWLLAVIGRAISGPGRTHASPQTAWIA